MTRRQVEEYKAKAAVRSVELLATGFTTNFMCEHFPYPGCYQKAEEITNKAATDFWVAIAQAGLASVIR